MTNLLFFFLGASLGSFAGLVIDRFPDQSLIFPSSHCQQCGQKLTIRDLIPILSQIMTGSRCRYCGVKLPIWYAGLELLFGIIVLGFWLDFISLGHAYWLMISLMLAIYDVKHQAYPLLIWLVTSLPLAMTGQWSLMTSIFLGLAFLAERGWLKMGSGDFLYLASLSLLLNLGQIFWLIQIACLVAIGYVLAFRKQKTTIPFVPFLLLAYLVVLIVTS